MSVATTLDARERRLVATVRAAGITRDPGDDSVVSAEQVEELPSPVQRFLGFAP